MKHKSSTFLRQALTRTWILSAVAVLCALVPSRAAAAAISYPLSMSGDGSQILDGNGRALFLNADAPWHIVNRLTESEAIEYLDDRQAKGFNSLLISILITATYNGTEKNRAGDGPFLSQGDFSTPNENYFAHIDWFFEAARQRGFLLFVTPAYLGYDCGAEGWCSVMQSNGVNTMRAFGRYLGTRYQNQPNIVWVNGGDTSAAAYGVMDLVDAVADGILDVDTNHLQTAHCSRYNSGIDCYDRPWLNFNTTYADCSTTARKIQTDFLRSATDPFVYIEGRYEFESNWSDVCVRSQAYWSLLGGAQGHFFGSGKLWDFPSNWRDGLNSTGSWAMAHFGRLMRSRRWDLLEPDNAHNVLVSNYQSIDSANYASAARTSDGKTILVYTPSQRTLTVDLSRLSASTAEAWWFDPRTGDATRIAGYAATGNVQFTPPSAGDWVLVIDDAGAGFDPPGGKDLFVPISSSSFGGVKGLYR